MYFLQMEIKTGEQLESKICMAFSVGVLSCLTQPPPPGIRAPLDHNKLGMIPPAPKYKPQYCGPKSVRYNDGRESELIMAAGWMMSMPYNYYFRHHHHHHHHHYGLEACRLWCGVGG